MFGIGYPELLVLALVGLIVLGPDRLPEYARDAARLLRTLRDVATGARQQLKDELGPEFADVDLRNLSPKAAVQRALLGEEVDLAKYHPRTALQDMLLGDSADSGIAEEVTSANGHGNGRISMTKPGSVPQGPDTGIPDTGVKDTGIKAVDADAPRPRPRPRPTPPTFDDAPTYDPDAT
jgi:sec-independent protein translocase protein TatB